MICSLMVVRLSAGDSVLEPLNLPDTLRRFFTPAPARRKVETPQGTVPQSLPKSPPVIEKKPLPVEPRRSTPAEWEQRKALYSGVMLARSPRVPELITLLMPHYLDLAQRHRRIAAERYRGKIRNYPVSDEFIPPEYLVSPEWKNIYAEKHRGSYENYCRYIDSLPEYERLVCTFILYSNIVGELRWPLLNLEPETTFPIDNLTARYFLANSYRNKMADVARKIVDWETGQVRLPPAPDARSLTEREILRDQLAELLERYPVNLNPALVKHYVKITNEIIARADEEYHGQILVIPIFDQPFEPKQKRWYENFKEYVAEQPLYQRKVCTYIQIWQTITELEEPIIDLEKGESYSLEQLTRRLDMIRILLPLRAKAEAEVRKIEPNKEITY